MFKGPQVPGQAPSQPIIKVRLNEAEYLMIATRAERDDRSLSGYVRSLIRRDLADVLDS